jgi:hypothetical protein
MLCRSCSRERSTTLCRWHGPREEALRYALLALCPGYSRAARHVWRASATVREDLQAESRLPEVGEAHSEATATHKIAARS